MSAPSIFLYSDGGGHLMKLKN